MDENPRAECSFRDEGYQNRTVSRLCQSRAHRQKVHDRADSSETTPFMVVIANLGSIGCNFPVSVTIALCNKIPIGGAILLDIRRSKQALTVAIERNRSEKWILRLWSRFIKIRDGYRCVCCESKEKVQAHHIVRKTLYPWGAFEIGNGISLCHVCHGRVHAQFNGRPDWLLPLGAEQGDDQDEWAFLFGLLLDDARSRSLDQDEFYYVGDHMLKFFMQCQGYEDLYELVAKG